MGEILGLGMTHYPPLSWTDDHMGDIFRMTLTAPKVPDAVKDRSSWPPQAVDDLADDDGVTAAREHRARLVANFRAQRARLDAFAPDFVVIFGDDQYENFREDVVPPFCVLGLEEVAMRPWAEGFGAMAPNAWGEPKDFRYAVRGHREGAKTIARGLLERGVDMPYAYQTLHHEGLAHAFQNTVLYLDYDRRGFAHPIVPFLVNCYGSSLLTAKGGFRHLFEDVTPEGSPDPPGPQPWRCMEVGAKLAETLAESPWRAALIASSSWSHAFLASKTGYLWPDREGDRVLYEALRDGDYDTWRERPLREVEASGQHELLNWYVLLGAMETLGRRAVIHDYIESWLLASNKCFAEFPV